MKIKDITLNKYINSWDQSLKWKKDELSMVRKILKSISLYNGGNIDYDMSLDQKIEELYIIKSIDGAISKVMNLYASSINFSDPGRYYAPLGSLVPKFNFLKSSKYLPKLDINTATAKELKLLPGIGLETAKRIKDYIDRYGPFGNIDDIKKVKGISKRIFEKIKYIITVTANFDVFFLSPCLLDFKKDPSFENYIKILKKTEGVFTSGSIVLKGDIRAKIIRELKKIREYIRENSYPEFGKYHRIRASKIKENYNIKARANKICDKNLKNLKGVSLIDDTNYLYFIIRALSRAKKRIYIIMFFMRFKEKEKYPTDRLIKELVLAKKRGVDVKVILDKDAEGDVYGSRVINKEVYEFFRKKGVDVTFDFEDEVTHSKIVIVDNDHVIVGSHNWTAGSFFAYDDKSFYIESKEFNKLMSERFLKLWAVYNADMMTRPVLIGGLIYTLSGKYIKKIKKAGINDTLEFLKLVKTPRDREKVSKKTKIPLKVVFHLAKISDLMRVKGIFENYALMLEAVSIETVSELAKKDSQRLYKELKKVQDPYSCFPIIDKRAVSKWINRAKTLKVFLEK